MESNTWWVVLSVWDRVSESEGLGYGRPQIIGIEGENEKRK